MGFVILMLLAGALAVFSTLLGRRWTFRLGWTDAAVAGFFILLAASASHAADRRIAINIAWQLIAVGLAYLLVRWLTRTASEQAALATLLVSTATALSLFGLSQTTVLRPELVREYRKNPAAALQMAGVGDDPASRRQFEDRLLGSREPTATFALTNTLAGYLIIPTLLAVSALVGQFRAGGSTQRRWSASALLVIALALLLACFLLTKSRSGYIGFLAGLILLGFSLGPRIPRKAWAGLGMGFLALVGGLIIVGLATRQLDRWVLTGAGKSLKFRSEYWIATLRMLQAESAWWWVDLAGWWGVGLGNFAGPYLRYKLPEASEGIRDPHNLFLEVWATAGLLALVVLVTAIGLGLRDLFGCASQPSDETSESDPPVAPARWLVLCGGLGGWVLAMLIRPDLSPFSGSLNPFEGDWMRWGILLLGGAVGALTFGKVASAPNLLRAGLAAGFVGILINLLAAGGLTFAPTALMLWVGLALTLNLCTDRGCGVVRQWDGWGPAFAMGAAWAVLAGVFAGTMLPYFQAQNRIAEASIATARARRAYQQTLNEIPNSVPAVERARRAFEKAQPNYQAAADRYRAATQIDPASRLPRLLWAQLDLEGWRARGAVTDTSDLIWHRLDSQLKQATTPPRDPNNQQAHITRVRLADELLAIPTWPEVERQRMLKDRVDAIEKACQANPTSATLHAERARDLAAQGQWLAALAAGERALELDGITPHVDKKLPKPVKAQLLQDLETWKKALSRAREEQAAG